MEYDLESIKNEEGEEVFSAEEVLDQAKKMLESGKVKANQILIVFMDVDEKGNAELNSILPNDPRVAKYMLKYLESVISLENEQANELAS